MLACEAQDTSLETNIVESRTITVGTGLSFRYAGGFRIQSGTFGSSRSGFSTGPIGIGTDGIWIAGHSHHFSVAKFDVPELKISNEVKDLPIARNTKPYVKISPAKWDKTRMIAGLYDDGEKLFVTTTEYYDADGNNKRDIAIVNRDNSQLGFFSARDNARSAGWMGEIPQGWQARLGGTHFLGHASNFPINLRLSLGPSLYVWDGTPTNAARAKALMVFPQPHSLGSFGREPGAANPLFNQLSYVATAFIVGNDYVAVGRTGGLRTGIGYKVKQDNGKTCNGHCPYGADDWDNYYWKFAIDEILDANNPHDARPYEYGPLTLETGGALITGAAYKDRTLYLATSGDWHQSKFESNPVIFVHKIVDANF
ncbi:hypothetical protein R0137_06970 [Congregibacter brevis]|uniref:Uncharacterized protein n=1 Tax=Congregibacter brevis TaxID=3081201 RepID=A0ABZ0IGN3_9GAMM|nr:hypothetical protein R0137_06970 [Congregibacter sp. IMCC45268]